MKIAIPYWQGRVSPVFDESREILLIDIENDREVGRIVMKLKHKEHSLRAAYVAGLGAEWLICGAISHSLTNALISKKVKVFPYTRGSITEIIEAFLKGNLDSPLFLMPGCRRENTDNLVKSRDQTTL